MTRHTENLRCRASMPATSESVPTIRTQSGSSKASPWTESSRTERPGGTTERPELETMMRFIRSGDAVLVHSMDRLARNLGLVSLPQTPWREFLEALK